jgi:hypothetical protein
MNRSAFSGITLIVTLCLPVGTVLAQQADTTALEAEARALTQQFVGKLLPTLQGALADGGPVAAIDVCATQAPMIANELSQTSGWAVSRVSLKPRNTGSATPDIWETAVLETFDQRQAAGEPGPTLNASAIEDGDFRYMQAQPVLPLCLTCHGEVIAEDVLAALAEHYPGDLATGYREGQIRGAISLRKPMP